MKDVVMGYFTELSVEQSKRERESMPDRLVVKDKTIKVGYITPKRVDETSRKVIAHYDEHTDKFIEI